MGAYPIVEYGTIDPVPRPATPVRFSPPLERCRQVLEGNLR